MIDRILSYREMCEEEGAQTLQRGMNFHMHPSYSVILMSRRSNAPYLDRVLSDGITIEYEGHDEPKTQNNPNPKKLNQPKYTLSGKLTQNGKFITAVEKYKEQEVSPELVKVYEKILPGVWSLKGYFDLIDYEVKVVDGRKVFVFTLKLSEHQSVNRKQIINLQHTRLIPSEVKKEVWKRDGGKCVKCGAKTNLHFDHDLPFSKGGTSLTKRNIRLLCMKCNLRKSDKIE